MGRPISNALCKQPKCSGPIALFPCPPRQCQRLRMRAAQGVVVLRSLLQDRMAALNGRTVEYVLKQDRPAFVRLIGLSVAQVPGLAAP